MPWRALVATRADGAVRTAVEDLHDEDLGEGEVTVDVEWSAVNYKDAMVTVPGNRVARRSPLVPGVDLTGTVAASEDPSVPAGSTVLVHGYDLGVDHHGGFAERARVPAGWVVPLPEKMTTRHAAAIGTAGFTAVLSAAKLQRAGVEVDDGPVLVTGASGGVGSMAVSVLARLGYRVVASTGKADEHDYLRALGAAEVIGRDTVVDDGGRVLASERWAGAVDCVGGSPLAAIVRSLRYGGAVAASGLTAGTELPLNVYPFIIRGASVLGIDSVATPIAERRGVWASIADLLPAPAVDEMVGGEVGLEQLPRVLADVLASKVRGRVLVRPGEAPG